MFADMCMNVSLCLACVFYASHTQRLITKLRQEDITGEILKCDDSVECSGVGVGCFSLQTICSSSRWEQSHTGIKPVLTFKSKTSSLLTRTKDNTASKQKHKNNNNKNNKINNYFYFYYNKSFEASGVSAG